MKFLLYFALGDAPEILILILLFVTIVPLVISLLLFFIIRDVAEWEKSKVKKDKNPNNTN